MRKIRRLSLEELSPYQWQLPRQAAINRCDSQEISLDQSTQGAEPAVAAEQLNWSELFGNFNPVEIEVGIGKGLFLLTSALTRPDTNFFGIEVVRKYQLYATTRLAIRRLPNAKTVCADARWVLRKFIPAASVAAVHVYFPDPWWKARHKKRRVFTHDFARDIARILRARGYLHLASDVEEYFEVMTGIIQSTPGFREVSRSKSNCSIQEAGYQTNFERKARQRGSPVWRVVFERTEETIASADHLLSSISHVTSSGSWQPQPPLRPPF